MTSIGSWDSPPIPATERALRPEAGGEQKGPGRGQATTRVHGPGLGRCGSSSRTQDDPGDWELTGRTPLPQARTGRSLQVEGGLRLPTSLLLTTVLTSHATSRGRGTHTKRTRHSSTHPERLRKPPAWRPHPRPAHRKLGSHGDHQDLPPSPPGDSPRARASTTETLAHAGTSASRWAAAFSSPTPNPFQPRPLNEDQRASASWAPLVAQG